MIQIIILAWIASQLHAPVWIYVLIGLNAWVKYYHEHRITEVEEELETAFKILEDK